MVNKLCTDSTYSIYVTLHMIFLLYLRFSSKKEASCGFFLIARAALRILHSSRAAPVFTLVFPLRQSQSLDLFVLLNKALVFFYFFVVCNGVWAVPDAGLFLVSADTILKCLKAPKEKKKGKLPDTQGCTLCQETAWKIRLFRLNFSLL